MKTVYELLLAEIQHLATECNRAIIDGAIEKWRPDKDAIARLRVDIILIHEASLSIEELHRLQILMEMIDRLNIDAETARYRAEYSH